MRLSAIVAAFLLLFLPLSTSSIAAAQDTDSEAEPVRYTYHESSEMILEGSSNVGRSWDAQATEFGGSAEVTLGEGSLSFSNVTLEVYTGSILSDRGSVEEKIHEALRKDSYPFIFFRVDEVDVEGPASSEFTAQATGEMIVAGGRQNITVDITGTMDGENLRVRGEQQFHMEDDFGVERPSAMMGAIRAAAEVLVRFDMQLTPASN